MDATGTLFVADTGNHTIRKIVAGVVTTFAGTAGSSGSADGAGSAARFFLPTDVVVDHNGSVYVADSTNYTIRKIDPDGNVTTLAGVAGSSGSADGTGNAARFRSPLGLDVDSAGTVYVADADRYSIRVVTPAGVVTTLAGAAGAPGTADGVGGAARFRHPSDVAADSAGNLFVPDSQSHTIRRIAAGAVVTTFAGSPPSPGSVDGPALEAQFDGPDGVTVGPDGTLYVADTLNQTIREISPAGIVSTLAGVAGQSGGADGTGSNANFYYPTAVKLGPDGNLYVADSYNDTIRRVTPAGVVTTIAGTAGQSGSTDGMGADARFYHPTDLAVDPDGVIYVADYQNRTIRRIATDGTVITVAGLAGQTGTADGLGSNARFRGPDAVAVEADKTLWVGDSTAVRQITPAGLVGSVPSLVEKRSGVTPLRNDG